MSLIQTRRLGTKATFGVALLLLTPLSSLASDEVPRQLVETTQVQSELNNQSSTSRRPGAFDSEGKPLALPHDTAPVMEFSGSAYLFPTTDKAKKARSLPQNQQATGTERGRRQVKGTAPNTDSRPHVANHPNCRWLDSRMDHLEHQLNSIGRGVHHSDELRERQREWRCLRCGAEGPASYDLDTCRQQP